MPRSTLKPCPEPFPLSLVCKYATDLRMKFYIFLCEVSTQVGL